MTVRICAWCDGPIPARARADAAFCGKRCRQASWRFRQGAPRDRRPTDRPMRFAYADPPYLGRCQVYDHFHGVDDRCWNDLSTHHHLIAWLLKEFPDGWALSSSAAALPLVLQACPPLETRVAAWVRGERPTVSHDPLNAWEPVIVYRGRRYRTEPADRRVDALVFHSRPRTADPHRVMGAKPPRFAYWMFDLLGVRPGDELEDLYPGSGTVGAAFDVATAAGPGDASRLQTEFDVTTLSDPEPVTVPGGSP